MKKNIAMRVAAILFILTMISTCAFSTTFAKYITTDETQDTARVAKWGVKISVQGQDAFIDTYGTDDNDDNDAKTVITNSVIGKNGDTAADVVAPGTNGQLVSITISGTPEVASKVTFTVNSADGAEKATDIFLAKGTYNDYTKAGENDAAQPTFDLSTDYHPIVFVVKKNGSVEAEVDTLAEVEEYLQNESKSYDPNTELNVTYTVDWAWAFKGHNNAADTILGNLMAGNETGIDVGKYSLNISFKLNVTIEQID